MGTACLVIYTAPRATAPQRSKEPLNAVAVYAVAVEDFHCGVGGSAVCEQRPVVLSHGDGYSIPFGGVMAVAIRVVTLGNT